MLLSFVTVLAALWLLRPSPPAGSPTVRQGEESSAEVTLAKELLADSGSPASEDPSESRGGSTLHIEGVVTRPAATGSGTEPAAGALVELLPTRRERLGEFPCDTLNYGKQGTSYCLGKAHALAEVVKRAGAPVQPRHTVITDELGRFRIAAKKGQKFFISIRDTKHFNGLDDVSSGSRITAKLVPLVTLLGTAVDQKLRPVPRAEVSLVLPYAPFLRTVSTDDQGSFSFEDAPQRHADIVGTAASATPVAVPVTSGAPLQLVLARRKPLRGRVVLDGVGVADATVRSKMDGVGTVSGRRGEFELVDGCPLGLCALSATWGDYAAFRVTRAEDEPVVLELEETARLTATVRFEDQTRNASDAMLTLDVSEVDAPEVIVLPDRAEHTWRRLPTGEVTVTATAEGAGRASARIRTTSGAQSHVELVLPRPVELRGRVLDPGGAPVAGADVRCDESVDTGPAVRTIERGEFVLRTAGTGPAARTNERGEFVFRGATPGSSILAVDFEEGAVDFLPARMEVLVPAPSPVEIVLQRAVRLHGRLRVVDGPALPKGLRLGVERDAPGERIEGLAVEDSAHRWDTHSQGITWHLRGGGTVLLEGDGRFTVGGLAPGRYRIAASAPGFTRAAAEFVAAPGAPAINLEMRRAPTIGGRVVDQAGDPVPGADVEWVGEGFGARQTRTDERGVFTIDARGAGTVAVRARADEDAAWSRFHEAVPGTVLVLPSSPARVFGRVVDARGRPVRSFQVDFQRFDVSDGRFEVDVEGPPPHTLIIESSDGALEVALPPLEAGARYDAGTLKLISSSFEATLVDDRGVPLQDCGVAVASTTSRDDLSTVELAVLSNVTEAGVSYAFLAPLSTAMTDDHGRFRVRFPATGRGTLSIACEDRTAYLAVVRTAGGDARLSVSAAPGIAARNSASDPVKFALSNGDLLYYGAVPARAEPIVLPLFAGEWRMVTWTRAGVSARTVTVTGRGAQVIDVSPESSAAP